MLETTVKSPVLSSFFVFLVKVNSVVVDAGWRLPAMDLLFLPVIVSLVESPEFTSEL